MRTHIQEVAQESKLIWDVTKASQVGPYILELEFNGGDLRSRVDFEPFLRSSLHPDIKAYLEPDHFSSFQIKDGTLMWGDYDLIFPVEDLVRGQIS